MSTLYITNVELKSFFPHLSELQSADTDYLDDNIIARTKLAIDRHCFVEFDDVDTTSDKYLDVQMAQKLLAGKLFLREQESVKTAKQAVGKGSERRGDWTYSLGDIDDLFDDEINNILEKYRDWTQEDAQSRKLKTGTRLLEGDVLYETETNS